MINIFAKPGWYHISSKGEGHLYRGSSIIRGEQVAEYVDGIVLNPNKVNKGDVNIYVKPESLENIKDGEYADILDSIQTVNLYKERPGIKIIACTKLGCEVLKTILKNKIVYIPQHHCNVEKFKKDVKEVKTVGIIGAFKGFVYPVDLMRDELSKIGIELRTCFDFKDRQSVVEHYKNIDIQINWQKPRHYLKNPLDIINAASFGIPTVCNPQEHYKEIEGYFIPAKTIPELLQKVSELKDITIYKKWSKKLIKFSQKYHIDEVGKLYKKL